MFVRVAERTTLPVTAAGICSVMSSFNQVSLAIPGHEPEQAQAWVVGHATPRGQYSVGVYILLRQSGTPVVYVSDEPPVPAEGYASLEADAVGFVESMGFMLDNLGYGGLPPERRAVLLSEFPFLQDRPKAQPISAVDEELLEEVAAVELRPVDMLSHIEAMTEEQRLQWARFLASF